jgi:hypothetical protein
MKIGGSGGKWRDRQTLNDAFQINYAENDVVLPIGQVGYSVSCNRTDSVVGHFFVVPTAVT